MGSVDTEVLNERSTLARDGVVAVFLPLDTETHELVGDPTISILGFLDSRRAEELSARACEVVEAAVGRAVDSGGGLAAIESLVQDELSRFIHKDTRRRPRLLIQTTPL